MKKIFSVFLILLLVIASSSNTLAKQVDKTFSEEDILKNNEEVAKTIKDRFGIDIKITEGILYYDPEEAKSPNNFGIEIQAISPPTRVTTSYPYESDWSGTQNYSYSRYIFEIDTHFGSNARTPYHIKFYSSSGEYLFTMRARERRGIYSANIYMDTDVSDYYGISPYYYVTMNNDSSDSSAKEAYYAVDRY